MNRYTDLNRESYERELAERQRRHLDGLQAARAPWRPCMHDNCQSCHGTGVTSLGTACVHMISCPCPRCSPVTM